MATAYDPLIHEWVSHPKLEGTRRILHTPGTRVWVHSSYAETLEPTWTMVGDGLNDGHDVMGNGVISIPRDECTFHTEEEAEQIEAMRDADERLLRYARG